MLCEGLLEVAGKGCVDLCGPFAAMFLSSQMQEKSEFSPGDG